MFFWEKKYKEIMCSRIEEREVDKKQKGITEPAGLPFDLRRWEGQREKQWPLKVISKLIPVFTANRLIIMFR